MTKILYDVRFASLPGNSGIPQDTRLLARTLASLPDVDLSLFFHPVNRDNPGFSGKASNDPDLALALLVQGADHPQPPARRKASDRIRELVPGAPLTSPLYHLRESANPDIADSVWRRYFAKSLSPTDRTKMAAIRRVVSGISDQEMTSGATWRRRGPARLDTAGFDFLLFQDARLVEASPGTTKVMRYHDPLPVVAADTFDLDWAVNHHYYMTRRVAQDSHFVCNSQVTMDQLLRLAPHVEGRAHVVPYTLPDLSVWPYQDADLGRIIRQRATITSLDTAGRNEADRNAAKTQLAQAADAAESFDYVLMVSTIEPRKNFIGAIAAVNALRMRTGKDLKFIIVGRPGWAFAETMRAIAPEVIAGDVIHLVDVSFNELLNLYKKARALVFPSFGEGFGFTPMEALQCGTPAVVSDIPVHRWVMDDAVLYADPYDTGAIVDQLDRLLYSDNAESLRQELLSRGPAVLDRYSPSRTRDQWANLFDELSRAKR